MSRTTYWALAVVAGAVVWGASALRAGDTDPPAGPVAPSMKTLDEITTSTPINQRFTPGDHGARFVVRESGRYHLEGDITEVVINAIRVEATSVIIDLNGHTLSGLADLTSPPGQGVGIRAAEGIDVGTVTVANGTVIGFATGISADGSLALNDVKVMGSSREGVRVRGDLTMQRCRVVRNGRAGVLMPVDTSRFVITQSIFHTNGESAVSGGGAGLIAHCVSEDNDQDGTDFNVSPSTLITDSIGTRG